MRVSIITVCYNSAATIADTIRSVSKQKYPDIEHIIIDGVSTDGTLDIIKNSSFTGTLVSENDNGLYDAMNKGIKMATGDVVGILNSDDFYPDENVITDVVKHLIEQDCDAVYADLDFINMSKPKKIVRKWRSGQYRYEKFNFGWMPPHPTFFVKREVYEKYGLFNTGLKSAADYELILRFLYVNKVKAEYLPRVLVHMRAGGVSNRSFSNRLKAHLEDYKAWRINGGSPHWYTMVLKPLRKVFQYM
ncbi:glycosyltransferase family 2 protein [Aridibaculum aurantiacum]|uniref:glycosyltransferase family 2 protein n=1 Tax=Aridibaculum aurantiacum TaxID=2810307 RepID=UPI001A9586F3|nr:glycosyltransferase family 2 protein [Aridibaculum aurantiacum]